MDDDDRAPLRRGDVASHLAGERLDSYSLDELDARVALLEAEIERVMAHRSSKSAHLSAAAALFRPKAG